MSDNSDDLCPQPVKQPPVSTKPHSPPIYLSSVYECDDPAQADRLLSASEPGFVYSRDGHPNGAMLADKCRELHRADQAAIASSGMGALAAAMLATVKAGEHIVVSKLLYGRSITLLTTEAQRMGIENSVVDTCDLNATRAALKSSTRLVVVESITNPLLRVSDISALAELCHSKGAKLLVDNTLAGPLLCRPIELGADFVLESLTKSMNGHSDLVLGLLCGHAKGWDRVPSVLSTFGLSSSAFDCWLALRGISTLAVRTERSNENAHTVAKFLSERREVTAVYYPGLMDHVDHDLAKRQFSDRYGALVTFTLPGGQNAAASFMRGSQIPFCPSLGELNTTLSHPRSTSHRALSEEARLELGIEGGTIRLSVGIESAESILSSIERGLAAG